jgi:hypothetical protein
LGFRFVGGWVLFLGVGGNHAAGEPQKTTTMTSIDRINSNGIRAALVATGDTYATKVGTYDHPQHAGNEDFRVTLWLLPCGEFVFETNGDPVFETDDAAFALACEEYGIDVEQFA